MSATQNISAAPVAVIGAMAQEVELLKSGMENVETRQIGRFTLYHGLYAGKPMVLAQSGIGKVNAAVATTLVVELFHPACVINTGSAGGLGQGLKVGDVVIGTHVAHHDVDATAFGYEIGQVPQLPRMFAGDARLVAAAVEAAAAFDGAHVHQGLIVSGDQFIHSSDKVAAIRANFDGVQVVEMEAAAIAQACAQLDVPCVVIRAVSDLADDKAEMSFDEFLQTAAVHSAKMVQQLIRAL